MPTQPERNAETRRRLLTAARDVFAEQGFAQATVAAIVKRAGRAQGSFYLHFPNKDAVLRALIDDAMARLPTASPELWRWDASGSSVREAIRRFVRAFGEDRDLWLLLDRRSSLDPEFRRLSDQVFRQLTDAVLLGITVAKPTGLPAGLDRAVLARVLAAMLAEGTRSAFEELHAWSPDDLADEVARFWSLTLGYDPGAAAAPLAP